MSKLYATLFCFVFCFIFFHQLTGGGQLQGDVSKVWSDRSKVSILGAVIDPRFKKLTWLSDEKKEQARRIANGYMWLAAEVQRLLCI